MNTDEVTMSIQRDAKMPVKRIFSVSLVYGKYRQKSYETIEYTTRLKVLITDAYSEEEALGKACNELNDDGFSLINQCVVPVNVV